MSGHSDAKVVHAGEGKMIAAAGDLYTFLPVGEDTSRSYALWEAVVPPGGGPPPHVQSREDEGFYILEGGMTFVADGQRVVALTGPSRTPPGASSIASRSRARPTHVHPGCCEGIEE
jgi:mannose-6-phosphate isomerase-like protein (cupin superfamily)